jgi:HK97 family phage major capsid protein
MSEINHDLINKLTEVVQKAAEVSQSQGAETKALVTAEMSAVLKSQADQAKELAALKASNDHLESLFAKNGAVNTTAHLDKKAFFKHVDSLLAKADKNVNLDIGELVSKTQSASDSHMGGAFLPQANANGIFATYMKDFSPIMNECNIVTLSRGSNGSKFALKEVKFGAKFAGEKEAGGKTEVNTRSIDINVNRITTENQTTIELLLGQNLITEQSLIADLYSDLSYEAQYQILRGDGIGKPAGLLNEKFLSDTAWVSQGQTGIASSVTWTDLINVKRQFGYSKYRNGGKYYLSYDVLADLLTQVDNEGRPLYNATTDTIMGSKYVILDEMDSLLSPTTLPVLYGDMKRAYTVVVGAELPVSVDTFTQANRGLVNMVAHLMVGGHTVDQEAIRAIKGA